MTPMPDPAILAGAAAAGLALGSFLNVCIHRWPRDESVLAPRSRCPACGRPIPWYENIPVASYVALRGRCRGCHARISLQYPLVELATGLVWSAAVARYGLTLEAARAATFLTLLLGIALTDARHYLIPDQFSLGGLALGLAFAALPGHPSLPAALAGAALGFASLWAVGAAGERLFRKPAMGGGDIKMMAMVGSFLGPAGALLTLFLGAALGTLVFGPIGWRTGKPVPFGIFLALGAAVALGWGDDLIAWYANRVLAAP